MKTTRTRLLLASALVLAATAYGQSISTFSPTSAAQGESVLVSFTLSGNVPPAGALPSSVTLGTISGTSVTHASQYIVTAQFAIPAAEAVGWKDAAIGFAPPMGSSITLSKTSAFQVTVGSGVAASFSGTPTSGTVPLTVSFTDASTGTITNRLWSFGDGTTSSAANPSHTYTNAGTTDNFSEYVADTNPTNVLSWFHIESIATTPNLAVSFASSASRVYTLYYRTNLTSGTWTNIPTQTDISGSGGMDTLTDPSPADAERFYRLGARVP